MCLDILSYHGDIILVLYLLVLYLHALTKRFRNLVHTEWRNPFQLSSLLLWSGNLNLTDTDDILDPLPLLQFRKAKKYVKQLFFSIQWKKNLKTFLIQKLFKYYEVTWMAILNEIIYKRKNIYSSYFSLFISDTLSFLFWSI